MKLVKKYKWMLLISSIIILLPCVFGAVMWQRLPEQMAIHWGINGGADGVGSRLVAVLLLPCILLAVHWLCILITLKDNERSGQGARALKLALWIVPVISLYANGIIYATAFGMKFDMYVVTAMVIGAGFVFLGNYMPKFSRNRTLGIKVYWALADDENWNATHRFGGKLWVIGGLLILLSAFLPSTVMAYVMVGVFLVIAIAPIVYSYVFYRKQLNSGRLTKETFDAQRETSKTARITSLVLVLLILAGTAVVMFTGEVRTELTDKNIQIKATYRGAITVSLDEIDSIEYREAGVSGTRVNGFGSPRLLLGIFQNEEMGSYIRYTYGGSRPCIVLTVNGEYIVVGLYSAEETQTLYNSLLEKCEKTGQ